MEKSKLYSAINSAILDGDPPILIEKMDGFRSMSSTQPLEIRQYGEWVHHWMDADGVVHEERFPRNEAIDDIMRQYWLEVAKYLS